MRFVIAAMIFSDLFFFGLLQGHAQTPSPKFEIQSKQINSDQKIKSLVICSLGDNELLGYSFDRLAFSRKIVIVDIRQSKIIASADYFSGIPFLPDRPPLIYLPSAEKVVAYEKGSIMCFDKHNLLKKKTTSLTSECDGSEVIWPHEDGKRLFISSFSKESFFHMIFDPVQLKETLRKKVTINKNFVYGIVPIPNSSLLVVVEVLDRPKKTFRTILYSCVNDKKISEVFLEYPVSCVRQISSEKFMMGTEGGSIHIWNTKSHEIEVSNYEMKFTVSAICVADKGKIGICGSYDRKSNLIVFDLDSLKIRSKFLLKSPPLSLCVNSSGDEVMIGSAQGDYLIFSLDELKSPAKK